MSKNGNVASLASGCLKPNFKKIKRDSKTFDYDFKTALYYIHYSVNSKKKKEETLKYIKKNSLPYPNIDVLTNYYFDMVGKPCYILNQGADVTPEWEEALIPKLEELHKTALSQLAETSKADKVISTETKKAPSIQDSIKAKASDIASNFDGWIDEYHVNPYAYKLLKGRDPYKFLMKNGVKSAVARVIKTFYDYDITEISDNIELRKKKKDISEQDQDLLDAYAFRTKGEMQNLLKLYASIVDGCDSVIASDKATRKTTSKKPVSLQKQVEKIKYLKSFVDLGLTSLPTTDIIGAQEIWVYNTKTRKLGVFKADHPNGLSVKGASIISFDKTKSVCKTIRKPKEIIPGFRKTRKNNVWSFFDKINSIATKLPERLSGDQVIIKCIK